MSSVAEEHASAVLAGMTSDELDAVDESARAANKKDIVNAGGIEPLVQLLRAGSMGAKKHASLTLAQLSRSAKVLMKRLSLRLPQRGRLLL